MQYALLAPHEANARQADRIRPLRRARREHAALSLVARRHHLQRPAARVVAPEQHPQMAEAVEVGEAVLQALPDLDAAVAAAAETALPRCFVVHPLLAAHDADRRQLQGVG